MKPDRDLDVDERVAFFKQFAARQGSLVVLDTGILGCFDFSQLLKPGTLQGPELRDTLAAERSLLERLNPIFREGGFVFPQEVREEYALMTKHLESKGRHNGDYAWYSPMVHARRGLFLGLPLVRDLISPNVKPYMRAIDESVIAISGLVYEDNPALRHARTTKKGLAVHALDDEHILAKGFALSYGFPVRIVSTDRDFVDIYRGIALNTDVFMQKGVTSLPDNKFELVFIGLKGSMELFDFARVQRHQTYRNG